MKEGFLTGDLTRPVSRFSVANVAAICYAFKSAACDLAEIQQRVNPRVASVDQALYFSSCEHTP